MKPSREGIQEGALKCPPVPPSFHTYSFLLSRPLPTIVFLYIPPVIADPHDMAS